MPFFRCNLSKLDSIRFRFDSNSLPIYIRDSLELNNDNKNKNKGIKLNEINNNNDNEKTDRIYTKIDRPLQCHWQQLLGNHRCPFTGINVNFSKIFHKFSWNKKSDHDNRENKYGPNQTSYRFEFDSLNIIRLLETFGVLGASLAVGIDVHTRISQWSPERNRREYDNSYKKLLCKNEFHKSYNLCPARNLHRSSCHWCKCMCDKLSIIPSFFTFQSTKLNVIEQTPVFIEKNVPPNEPISTKLDDDETILTNDQRNENLEEIFSFQSDDAQIPPNNSEFTELPSNEIHQERKQICENSRTIDHQNDCISSDDDDDVGEKNVFDEKLMPLIRENIIKYTDKLNNLSGIELIKKKHGIDDAISCWLSCEQRNSSALFNLGVAFENGLHNNNNIKDLNKAFEYYTLAAKKGHPKALYNLSLYYLYGKNNVKIDVEFGLKLLRLAADKGVKQAIDFLKNFDNQKQKAIKKHSNVQQSMTPCFKNRRSLSSPSLLSFGSSSSSLSLSNSSLVCQNISLQKSPTYSALSHIH